MHVLIYSAGSLSKYPREIRHIMIGAASHDVSDPAVVVFVNCSGIVAIRPVLAPICIASGNNKRRCCRKPFNRVRHAESIQREAAGLEVDFIDGRVVHRGDGLHIDVVGGNVGGIGGGVHARERLPLQRQVEDFHVILGLGAQAPGKLALQEGDVNGHRAPGLHFIPIAFDIIAQLVLSLAHEGEVIQQGVFIGVFGFGILPVQGFHISVIIIIIGRSRDRGDKQFRVVGGTGGAPHRDDGIDVIIVIGVFYRFISFSIDRPQKDIFGNNAEIAIDIGIDPGSVVFAVSQRVQLDAVHHRSQKAVILNIYRAGFGFGELVYALFQHSGFEAADILIRQVNSREGDLNAGIIGLRLGLGNLYEMRQRAAFVREDRVDLDGVHAGCFGRPLEGTVFNRTRGDDAFGAHDRPFYRFGFRRVHGKRQNIADQRIVIVDRNRKRRFSRFVRLTFDFLIDRFLVDGLAFRFTFFDVFDFGLFAIFENILRICPSFDFSLFFAAFRLFDLSLFALNGGVLGSGIPRRIGNLLILSICLLYRVIHRGFRRIRTSRRSALLLLRGSRRCIGGCFHLFRFRCRRRRGSRFRCGGFRCKYNCLYLLGLYLRGKCRGAFTEIHDQHHDRAQHSENPSALHKP